MSAAATAPIKDQNLALIVAMGGSRERGYDPIPPDQYEAFLDEELQLTPRAHRMLAWLRSSCLRPKRCGRTPYAADERKRPLRLSDAADQLGWDAPAAWRVWKELEEKSLVTKDKDGKLWLNGTVQPWRKKSELEETGIHKKTCTDNLPRYIVVQIERLPEISQRRVHLAIEKVSELEKQYVRDAIFGARELLMELLYEVLAQEGIVLRRQKAADDEAANTARIVKLITPKLSVQEIYAAADEQLVQAMQTAPYTVESDTVHVSHPYSPEDREENRVSAGEPEAPAGFSCEDSLTDEDAAAVVAEAQEDGTPAADDTTPANPLPVECGESTPAAAVNDGPAVAYVEKLFCKPLNPTLRSQFVKLAPEHGISQIAAARFLLDKTEEKIRKGYAIDGPPALLKFAQADLPAWIALNRPYLARTAAQTPAADVPEPFDTPAEKLASLERFIAETPDHPQIDEWRRDAAELRAHLGADAPAPYQPEPPENELARLEAQLTETPADDRPARYVLKKKIAGIRELLAAELVAAVEYIAAHPEGPERERRARIEKLRRVLESKRRAAGS